MKKNQATPPAVVAVHAEKAVAKAQAKPLSLEQYAAEIMKRDRRVLERVICAEITERADSAIRQLDAVRVQLENVKNNPARLYDFPFRHGSKHETREAEQRELVNAYFSLSASIREMAEEIVKASAARDAEIPPDVLKRLRDERRC